MAVAARDFMVSPVRKEERVEMERRRNEFDAALENLRRAKERLANATDLYLERLEGTKRERNTD